MIILLNGPAGSGKDTIAKLLKELGTVQQVNAFKEPMFDIALVASGIGAVNPQAWWDRYNDRDTKEKPWGLLGGMSCREFMIHISEKFVKPVFGDGYFGKQLALKYINRDAGIDTIAVPDSGFDSELAALSESVGPENILIVRLWRDGYTFDGDSRNYVTALKGNHVIDITLVDGYPSQAVGQITCVLNAINKGSDVAQTK